MVRGKGIQGQVLNQTEIETLRDQKRELEAVFRDKDEYGKGTAAESIDVEQIQREIRRIDSVLVSQDQSRKLSASELDKAMKRMDEIEEICSKGMPTSYEMDKPHKNPGAVRKHLEWSARNAKIIAEYKQLRNITQDYGRSIESLRKDR